MKFFQTGIFSGIQVAALLLTSCHRNLTPEEVRASHDKVILDARAWRESVFDFAKKSDDLDRSSIAASDAEFPGIDSFKLGMTPERVRAVARSLHFMNSGVPDRAWCRPPRPGTDEPAVISTPAVVTYNGHYKLYFDVYGSKLRVGRIELLRESGIPQRSTELTAAQQQKLLKISDKTFIQPCDLTQYEYNTLSRYYELQNNPLYFKFTHPIYEISSLPQIVQNTAGKWEKAVYIPLPRPCCDAYSRSASFRGAWYTGGSYVIIYNVDESGIGDITRLYTLVIRQNCKITWAGDAEEFAARGFKGKQRRLIDSF